MSDKLVLCVTMSICIYEFETSFTNISGSNGPILIKFTQLCQQIIQSLNTTFQGTFNYFIKPFNVGF